MTTLVIKSFPDKLHARLKRVATEHRRSVTQEAIVLLEQAVDLVKAETVAKQVPYFARRELLPQFQKLQKTGALKPRAGDRNITDLISDDRDERA